MHAYLATMFWLGVLGVLVGAFNLTQNHPRTETFNIGKDLLKLIAEIVMLAWVSVLYYGASS